MGDPANETIFPSELMGHLVTVHVSMLGDVTGSIGQWVGDPQAQRAIEGIMLAANGRTLSEASPLIEYQLVYKHGLMTSWTAMPHYSGSRGLDLPCIGIRFRISGGAVGVFECSYDARFSDGTQREGLSCEEIAIAQSEASLTSIRVQVRPMPPVERPLRNDPSPHPPPPGGGNDYDDDTVRLRLQSPAFDARPPEIRNPDLIPQAPRHAMEQSWCRHVFLEQPLRFRVIDEAFVVREGLVFDRNLAVVQSSKLHFPDTDVASARREIEAARGAGCVRRIRGTGLLCKSPAASNYGHYLIEMFPKAWLGKKIFDRHGLSFIVHQSDIMMIVAESLIKIGIQPTDIAWTGGEPVACDRLIAIDGMTYHGQFQSPLCDRALTELASSITPGKDEKLFIPRRSRTRPLINEEEVQAVLEKTGFRVIEPGVMSLKEQIATFKGATTVVGSLGAALTNIAFCPKGSKIVALTSASFPDTFFWFQSQHRQHEYLEIRCKDVSEFDLNQETWSLGFQIDLADIQYLSSL